MRSRHRRLLAGIASGVLVIAAGIVMATQLTGSEEDERGDGEMPTALGRHLEQLHEALPGAKNEEETEGPASSADAAFLARAYPGQTIALRQMDTARTAYARAKVRPFPKGKGVKGTWTTIGPSRAIYPDSDYRNSYGYVPNEYIASGRTTSIAISDTCNPGDCTAWVTPAGGGVWRTRNILAGTPVWEYLGGPLGINAAGTVAVDHNDPTGKTVYVGTGEANACGSGCVAGVGLYKSTDGGDHWTGPLGKAELGGKGIGDVAVKPGDPNTLYVATTTALRGMSSVCCGGVTRPVPDAAKWGLYKSTDGGSHWTFVHNGSADAADCTGSSAEFNNQATCSPRGVRFVKIDPSHPDTVYASSYARGVWRSTDAGASWTQIKPSLNANAFTTVPAFDVAALPGGNTRMYVFEGNTGNPYSRLFRSDDVATGTPTFTDLTSKDAADPGYAWYNMCGGQCWYDAFVHTPKGHPDMVYVGGSYAYGETIANKRAVVLSTDAGVSGTDMTMDGTDPLHPNGLHPDEHALATNPNNPLQFFETNDGGIMRSSGALVDRSSWCDDDNRGLDGAAMDRCRQMLSRIPSKLDGINDGLSTLQFMSLSVSPHDATMLQGGTQDNGTWENHNIVEWKNTMIGDGGQSGFDVGRPEFRFHSFYDATPEVNFHNGDIGSWIWTADPLYGQAGTQFYAPIISDPKVSGTMFAGTGRTVFRTKTFGLGNRSLDEANRICNSWTGTYEAQCGDWVPLGGEPLTGDAWGDRAGGGVAAVERAAADTGTVWAATTTGRVFVSHNADAEPATSVSWTRLDDDATTPNRFVSGIYVDPTNGNHAWISYSGFDSNTPQTPGHVFEVTVDPASGKATWTDRSYDLGDQPISDLVRDDVTGDLYAATDFGVLRLAAGTSTWTAAAPGMPNVEVTGLTIVPGQRILYAASHGLGAWQLNFTK